MTLTQRTLAPEEVHRALEAGGPLVDLQVDVAKLREMSIAVVEVDGQIVAYWVGFYALHIEPLWIQEAWRKHPAVVGGIVDAMRAMVERTQEPVAYCEIAHENLEIVGAYADRLGFQPAPGRLFYLVLQQPAAPLEV